MTDSQQFESENRIEKLSKETLQDRVHRQISDMILEGAIVPGQLVKIQALANSFGVSAMPVREALQRLTAENALTVVAGRSIGIPQLNHNRLTDLRNVRMEIESIAVSWAAKRITEADLDNLRAQLKELSAGNQCGDTRAYLRANHNFHFTIYRSAGSPALLNIIENLWLQISPYFNLLHTSGNYSMANEQHQRVLEALEERNAVAARNALRKDIEAAYRTLVNLVT